MEFHFTIELFCALIGLTVFLLSWPLYKEYKSDCLFWFSVWGLILGGLSFFHAVISYFPLCNIPDYKLLPFTYLPERIGDSIITMLCVYPAKKKISTALLLLACFILIILIGIVSEIESIRKELIGRPQEILQIIPAAIVFGRLLNTITPWGKILRYGTLTILLGGIIMGFSNNLYDIEFNSAHVFKLISYLFMLFAILYLRKWLWMAGKGQEWIEENLTWNKGYIHYLTKFEQERNN